MKTKKKNKGFTLVEALISISILMISVAAPLNIAGTGLISSKIAEKQIIANYLAQDMLEVIINIKASNKINNYNSQGGILAGLSLCDIDNRSNGCYINTIRIDTSDTTRNGALKACNTKLCPSSELYYDKSSGIYSYQSSAGIPKKTGFKRIAKIKKISVTAGEVKEALVTVTVSWNSPSGKKQIYEIKDRLTNW